jgi:hypothetical protein
VQLVAYEAQYSAQRYLADQHENDNMDLAFANVLGATAGVCMAHFLTLLLQLANEQAPRRPSALSTLRIVRFVLLLFLPKSLQMSDRPQVPEHNAARIS